MHRNTSYYKCIWSAPIRLDMHKAVNYRALSFFWRTREELSSTIWYKRRLITKLKGFSSRLAVVFAQSIEDVLSREDVVGVGAAPTTPEWSTVLLHARCLTVYYVCWQCTDLAPNYTPPLSWSLLLLFACLLRSKKTILISIKSMFYAK